MAQIKGMELMVPSHRCSYLSFWFIVVAFLCTNCGARSALLESGLLDDGAGGPPAGSTSGGGDSADAPVDLILSESPESDYEHTTDLKLGSNSLVAVTWIGHPAGKPSSVGYAFSTDGGVTFTPPRYIETPGNLYADQPTLAINPKNEVFVSWLGQQDPTVPSGKAVFVARASDGLAGFEEPITLATEDGTYPAVLTHPRIAVTDKGTLIDVFHDAKVGGNPDTAARSTDGVTWTDSALPAKSSSGANISGLVPCTFADGFAPGPLALAYDGLTTGVVETEDDGVTWNVGAESSTTLAIARCTAAGGEIYMSDSDGGLRLVTGPADSLSSSDVDAEFFPKGIWIADLNIAVDMAQGIDLVFHGSFFVGSSPRQGFYLVRASRWDVTKGYATIIKEPLEFETLDDLAATYVGRYPGLATRQNLLFVSYVDNSSGASHIAYRRMELPPLQ